MAARHATLFALFFFFCFQVMHTRTPVHILRYSQCNLGPRLSGLTLAKFLCTCVGLRCDLCIELYVGSYIIAIAYMYVVKYQQFVTEINSSSLAISQ